jgi:hypothetical protein
VGPPGIRQAGAIADHVFVSYSRSDQDYVDRLVAHLRGEGLDVWIDTNIDYGSTWPSVIRDAVDSCDAFVVVMTPEAERSEWVANEIQRAKVQSKPILPLLLEGLPFFVLGVVQHESVVGGAMPSAAFVHRLRVLTGADEIGDAAPDADDGRSLLERLGLTSTFHNLRMEDATASERPFGRLAPDSPLRPFLPNPSPRLDDEPPVTRSDLLSPGDLPFRARLGVGLPDDWWRFDRAALERSDEGDEGDAGDAGDDETSSP